MKNNLRVDPSSFEQVENEINGHNINILEHLKEIEKQFIELEECFSSKSGDKYRELLKRCVQGIKIDVESNNNRIVENLKVSGNLYNELYDKINSKISKG